MKLPPELQNLQRVCVFGMGKSGVAAVRLLKKVGLEVHAVNVGPVPSWQGKDGLEKALEVRFMHEQEHASKIFSESDLIILSPGIPSTHTILQDAHTKKVPIVSEIELAWWFADTVPTVAITGTNGKTTTTTMISESLKALGKEVFCGGNIGVPYCEMAMEILNGKKFDYAVIEVSSFQLETIKRFHPRVGLILNLTSNHTERYQGLHDYGAAKWRITDNMTSKDDLIIGAEVLDVITDAKSQPVRKHIFFKNALPDDFEFNFSRGVLVGEHNQANYYCAWKTLQLLGVNEPQAFQRFIDSFAGVEHRLEFVGDFNGLKVYNDAKSTNAEATRTALSAFNRSEPLHLIVGGKLRNESDRLLPELLPFKNRISTVFTLGMTTERLFNELQNDFSVVQGYDLDKLLAEVKRRQLKGNLVFSPAHPSFDQFTSYVNRGETFKKKVREILS